MAFQLLCRHVLDKSFPVTNCRRRASVSFPLVERHRDNTGVWPEKVAADDGYASAVNRETLLAADTSQVRFSTGTGKKSCLM